MMVAYTPSLASLGIYLRGDAEISAISLNTFLSSPNECRAKIRHDPAYDQNRHNQLRIVKSASDYKLES